MNKSVLVGLVVLVLVAVGAGGWFYMSGKNVGAPVPNAPDVGASNAPDRSEKAAAVPRPFSIACWTSDLPFFSGSGA